ncbi:MAG: hypothetical protein WDO56_17690 [Gammaproteobacteria bacterium]
MKGVAAPIASWLRALAAHVSEHNGGGRIGALGMCLTGAFAIPLVIDPRVAAAVAAQPAAPLSLLHAAFGLRVSERQLSALNVSDESIAEARMRLGSGEAHLLALRCRADRICPRDKIERFEREFPVGLEVREYGKPMTAIAWASGPMRRSRRNTASSRMRRPIIIHGRPSPIWLHSSTVTCEIPERGGCVVYHGARMSMPHPRRFTQLADEPFCPGRAA